MSSRTAPSRIARVSLLLALLSACVQNPHNRDDPVVPAGFDVGLLNILACPENLSPVRLATSNELAGINERVRLKKLRRWDGAPVEGPLEAALIREDKGSATRCAKVFPSCSFRKHSYSMKQLVLRIRKSIASRDGVRTAV
jgi:hypothetical protein